MLLELIINDWDVVARGQGIGDWDARSQIAVGSLIVVVMVIALPPISVNVVMGILSLLFIFLSFVYFNLYFVVL